MPLVDAGRLVTRAARHGCAVAAFNVITLEHIEAVLAGAEAASAGVVLQISENAVAYRQGQLLPIAAAAAAAAEQSVVDAALHLDHVREPALLRQAVEAGCGSVMVDAARLPYEENLEATREAVEWAHRHGVWVEAELGHVGGKPGDPPSDPHAPGARTDPEQAASFVARTGVDALAVAIGSAHAMTHRTARLDHRLLAELTRQVPVPLVLHGSSGVPDRELYEAVRGGIAKVNIGTALNAALTASARAALAADPALVDVRKWLAPGRAAMADTVAQLITIVSGLAPEPPSSPPPTHPAPADAPPGGASPGVRE